MASAGRGGKFSGLVSGDLAGGVVGGSKYLMGAFLGRLQDQLIVERDLWFRLSGSKILALLIEMAFDGGGRFWEMLAHEVGCEAWPSGKVTVIDCLDPS